jgi:hypothetical protein
MLSFFPIALQLQLKVGAKLSNSFSSGDVRYIGCITVPKNEAIKKESWTWQKTGLRWRIQFLSFSSSAPFPSFLAESIDPDVRFTRQSSLTTKLPDRLSVLAVTRRVRKHNLGRSCLRIISSTFLQSSIAHPAVDQRLFSQLELSDVANRDCDAALIFSRTL